MTKLVCQACRAQGFHPRNLDAFTCQTCKGNFGSTRFSRVLLNHYKQTPRARLRCTRCVAQESEKKATATRQAETAATTKVDENMKPTEKTLLVCKRYQTHRKTKQQKQTRMTGKRCQDRRLRCSKCEMAYEDACWTRTQRQNHRASHTKLVCKACRAQGFHPRNLEAYTCQTCNSNLGTTRFKKVMLKNYKQRPCVRLECMQCVAREMEKKATTTAQAAAAPSSTADGCASGLVFLSQTERRR